MAFEEKIKELLDKRSEAKMGGGQKRIDKQHEQGKLTAREPIAAPISICRNSLTSATAW